MKIAIDASWSIEGEQRERLHGTGSAWIPREVVEAIIAAHLGPVREALDGARNELNEGALSERGEPYNNPKLNAALTMLSEESND